MGFFELFGRVDAAEFCGNRGRGAPADAEELCSESPLDLLDVDAFAAPNLLVEGLRNRVEVVGQPLRFDSLYCWKSELQDLSSPERALEVKGNV